MSKSTTNNLNKIDRRLLFGCMLAVQAVVAPTADAQTSKNANAIENVTVTARRTEESLQSTPIAVTALTSETLQQKQITDLVSLQFSAPDMVIGKAGSSAGTTISLRGQVTVSSETNVDQSVGLYADGIYIARQQGGLMDLLDVERVEVLRGPQGTLFGRNTTGGAVNIITNKPTDHFEGWVRAGVGNYDKTDFAAVLNTPLGESTAARIAVQKTEHDGYGKNTFRNTDADDQNSTYVRASLDSQLADRVNILLSGDYYRSKNNGQTSHLVAFSSPPLPLSSQAYQDDDLHTTGTEAETFDKLEAWSGTATLTVDFDGATVKSITGYRKYQHDNLADYDGTPTPYYTNSEDTHHKQWSQELQLLGKSGNLEWITGLFYFYEQARQLYGPLALLSYDGLVTNTSAAPYAQATYQFTEKLRVTAGARYTWDTRKIRAENTIPAFGSCLINTDRLDAGTFCTSHQKEDFDYPSYTISADYQWTDNLFAYARTSSAHKSGGIGKTSPTLEVFDPEKVTDYEVGVKSDWFEQRLRVNAAAFISYYEHMQRPVTSGAGSSPVVLTQSVGKAEIPGAELEITAIPFEGLELTASAGLLDPKYTDFEDITGDRSSEPFTFISKRTAGLGATYTQPVSYGKYIFHVDSAYQSAKFFFPPHPGLPDYNRQGGYSVFNARFALQLSEPRIEIALWGKNLGDKEYKGYVSDFLLSAGATVAYAGDPRTVGANITYSF